MNERSVRVNAYEYHDRISKRRNFAVGEPLPTETRRSLTSCALLFRLQSGFVAPRHLVARYLWMTAVVGHVFGPNLLYISQKDIRLRLASGAPPTLCFQLDSDWIIENSKE